MNGDRQQRKRSRRRRGGGLDVTPRYKRKSNGSNEREREGGGRETVDKGCKISLEGGDFFLGREISGILFGGVKKKGVENSAEETKEEECSASPLEIVDRSTISKHGPIYRYCSVTYTKRTRPIPGGRETTMTNRDVDVRRMSRGILSVPWILVERRDRVQGRRRLVVA